MAMDSPFFDPQDLTTREKFRRYGSLLFPSSFYFPFFNFNRIFLLFLHLGFMLLAMQIHFLIISTTSNVELSL